MDIVKCEYDAASGTGPAVGLIVLQTDEVMERELAAWLPPEARLLHTRIPNGARVTTDALLEMERALPAAAALLPAGVRFDVVAYGCTSATTLIGADRVAALVKAVVPGAAVTDPLSAAKAKLESLGIGRIGLLTPYSEDIARAIARSFEADGIEVRHAATFDETDDARVARISERSVLEAMIRLGTRDDCDAVFASCTNLRALSILDEAERRIGKPVLTSNSALAWHIGRLVGAGHRSVPAFSPDWRAALDAVSGCPKHAVTPLFRLGGNRGGILLKDESARLGLGSFKALGGAYAVMEAVREMHARADGAPVALEAVFEPERRARNADASFVCASAGNHGIAVAAGAALLGANARIHLSAEVPEDFAQRLRGRGATVVRSGATYEQSLEAAEADAAHGGGALIADTAWDGYVEVPTRIMAGYTVIAEELRTAFEASGEWPTDVYLQAGVGGLAGALTWSIRHRWRVQPRIVIVEPDAAPCLARSAKLGRPATVEGPVSSMGRLDCKSASPLAFDALAGADVHYLALSDADAEAAVATLAEQGVRTTPSGAAGFAAWLRERDGGHTAGAVPLAIVSEGALDEPEGP